MSRLTIRQAARSPEPSPQCCSSCRCLLRRPTLRTTRDGFKSDVIPSVGPGVPVTSAAPPCFISPISHARESRRSWPARTREVDLNLKAQSAKSFEPLLDEGSKSLEGQAGVPAAADHQNTANPAIHLSQVQRPSAHRRSDDPERSSTCFPSGTVDSYFGRILMKACRRHSATSLLSWL